MFLSQVEVHGLSSPVVVLSSDDEDASSCFSSISVSQDSAQDSWLVQDSWIIASCDPLCHKTSERLQSATSSSYVSTSGGEDEIIYRRAAGVPWSHSSDYASDEEFLTDSDDGDDHTDAAKVCHVHLCLLLVQYSDILFDHRHYFFLHVCLQNCRTTLCVSSRS